MAVQPTSAQLKKLQRYEESVQTIREQGRINRFRSEAYVKLLAQKLKEYEDYCKEEDLLPLREEFP